MLRDWSDEWKNARLSLELRAGELFQGETIAVLLHASFSLDLTSPSSSHDTAGTAESDAALSSDEAKALALSHLESRWRKHCDGALVDLKIVEPALNKRDKSVSQSQLPQSSQVQQPRTTLFHQESRLVLLPVRRDDATHVQTVGANALKVTLSMRCECTVRIRAEFLQRALVMIARVTPNDARQDEEMQLLRGNESTTSSAEVSTQMLSSEFLDSCIFPLLREQTSEPPNLMRRAEYKVRIVKPLVLRMETRTLAGGRVAIIARATNTHETMSIRVLDLQLHVNQVVGKEPTGNHDKLLPTGEYRVVKSASDDFPVQLHPHEQYNFVFVMEPSGTRGAHESKSSPPPSASSLLATQQSLLTLSWETVTDPMEANAATLLQPITENHTIYWSPHQNRHPLEGNAARVEMLEWLPKLLPVVSIEAERIVDTSTGVKRPLRVLFRGDRACPLRVTLAPLHTSAGRVYRVGDVETFCVIVANATVDGSEFNLSLVLPAPHRARGWFAFEACHHLGRVPSGTIVRKSLRLVFLQAGRVDLNALLLYDHASHAWFLPPSSPVASGSSASAWDVVVDP